MFNFKPAVVLATLLCALSLAACGGDADITPPDTTAEPVTTAAPLREITFIGGDTPYTIIRPEAASEAVLNAAIDFYKQLSPVDRNLAISDDWLKPGTEPSTYEILIGEVDRAEIRSILPETPYAGYLIKQVGEKLIIVAGEDKYIEHALDYLIAEHLTDGRLTLPEGFTHTDATHADAYPLANAVLGETPLQQYAITARTRELAEAVQAAIGRMSGYRLPIVEKDAGEHLLIADTVYPDKTKPLTYYEYRLTTDADHVYLYGYDECAIGQAALKLGDAITAAGGKLAMGGDLAAYTLPDRAAYIADPSLLYMRWAHLWDAPALPDYETMKADIFGGKGTDKLYTMPHRAEWRYYPENSIEAVISAYYMGAAILELDFVATRDGVLILSHDDSLARMTNCADFIGKPGYPTTPAASAWTYAQIMDLNLKESGGGAGAAVTPFKVATLEEVLTFAKDRMFIVPDKQNHWQYVPSANIMQASEQHYLVDVMKKTGNAESIIISYGKSSANYLTAQECVQLQRLLFAETGVNAPILVRTTPDAARGNHAYLEKSAAPGTFALQINGDYRKNCDYASVHAALGDKVTLLAWTIGTGDGFNDFEATWSDMYKKGVRVIMTNDLLGLSRYAEGLVK